MIKMIMAGVLGVVGLGSVWASAAGWGVSVPQMKERTQPSIRQGSRRHRTWIFMGGGRRHGSFGGK